MFEEQYLQRLPRLISKTFASAQSISNMNFGYPTMQVHIFYQEISWSFLLTCVREVILYVLNGSVVDT